MPDLMTRDEIERQLVEVNAQLRAEWARDREDIRTVLDALEITERKAMGDYARADQPGLSGEALAAWRRLEGIKAEAPVPEAKPRDTGYVLIGSEDAASAARRGRSIAAARSRRSSAWRSR